VGLAVAVAVTIAINVAHEPGARPPDALGVTIGALLLVRRRWPLGVLVASVLTLQLYYYPANYPGIQPAVPLAVALYTAAAAGYLRWSLGVAAWYLGGELVFGAALGALGPLVPVLDLLEEQVRRESEIEAALA